MDPTMSPITAWLLQVGGPMAGLCLLFMFFYRKDMAFYTEQWKGQSGMLLEVVVSNTKAMTTHAGTAQALIQRLDEHNADTRQMLDRATQIAIINRTELDALRMEVDRRIATRRDEDRVRGAGWGTTGG